MGKPIEECLAAAIVIRGEQAANGPSTRVMRSEPATVRFKLAHLQYLPILGLKRPSDLYDYQGDGLQALFGFTYRYWTVEHFLSELASLRVGYPLADALGACWCKAWFPGEEGLALYLDWHTKPHWTQRDAHVNQIAMWGRVMPGTKQLIVNGPGGELLWAVDRPVDSYLGDAVVEVGSELAGKLRHRVAYLVFDSEGNGLPAVQRQAQSGLRTISVLPGGRDHVERDFELLGEWKTPEGSSTIEVVEARWRAPRKAMEDPRRLVLMRPVGGQDPTRVYAGLIPEEVEATAVPGDFRRRWANQERRIRELVNGANLNTNYGYQAVRVPNRTQQRRWAEAAAQVAVCERWMSDHRTGVRNTQGKLAALRGRYRQEESRVRGIITEQSAILSQEEHAGKPCKRLAKELARRQRWLAQVKEHYIKQRGKLLAELRQRRARLAELTAQRAVREAARDAIDTEALCWERNLERDQIMLCMQGVLINAHHWVRRHYLAPEWENLELETAARLIYRKRGRVRWGDSVVEVTLDAYRQPEHQQAMEESCRRLNAANIRWHDGRLVRMQVARGA